MKRFMFIFVSLLLLMAVCAMAWTDHDLASGISKMERKELKQLLKGEKDALKANKVKKENNKKNWISADKALVDEMEFVNVTFATAANKDHTIEFYSEDLKPIIYASNMTIIKHIQVGNSYFFNQSKSKGNSYLVQLYNPDLLADGLFKYDIAVHDNTGEVVRLDPVVNVSTCTEDNTTIVCDSVALTGTTLDTNKTLIMNGTTTWTITDTGTALVARLNASSITLDSGVTITATADDGADGAFPRGVGSVGYATTLDIHGAMRFNGATLELSGGDGGQGGDSEGGGQGGAGGNGGAVTLDINDNANFTGGLINVTAGTGGVGGDGDFPNNGAGGSGGGGLNIINLLGDDYVFSTSFVSDQSSLGGDGGDNAGCTAGGCKGGGGSGGQVRLVSSTALEQYDGSTFIFDATGGAASYNPAGGAGADGILNIDHVTDYFSQKDMTYNVNNFNSQDIDIFLSDASSNTVMFLSNTIPDTQEVDCNNNVTQAYLANPFTQSVTFANCGSMTNLTTTLENISNSPASLTLGNSETIDADITTPFGIGTPALEVEIEDPNTIKTNTSGILQSGNTYRSTYNPAITGTYTITNVYSLDSYGNVNVTPYNTTFEVTSGGGGGGGGGGGSSTTVLQVFGENTTSILDWGRPKIEFTVITTPTTQDISFTVTNVGTAPIAGDLVLSQSLTPYIGVQACDIINTNDCSDRLELDPGETAILSLVGNFQVDIGQGVAGLLEVQDPITTQSIPIEATRPPGYTIVKNTIQPFFAGVGVNLTDAQGFIVLLASFAGLIWLIFALL